MHSPSLLAALAGLGFGLSLIVAIGAQNLYVLRQGLRREHVGAVIAVCAGSDAVLITAGAAGAGVLVDAVPWLGTAMRWGGAAFLLVYAALAARRGLRAGDDALRADDAGLRTTLPAVVGTTAALTWLNPHVYLDTLVLLGSVAAGHGSARWWFAAGAVVGSVVWFTALGYGARLLRPLFARPTAWRVLDGVVAVVMTAIAVGLILGSR
ncbi:Lysine exporter protein (LYSE/YGGA) [Xylanimonas cellulosilytica DSM 15894]|uniref:Lysine exporter protein (LYSE/YGGA) n=1 Tax=Xylanimonas cellulosilytica (strain DSM 15894 / JCM 12276 / CECT 5975 / KCTC 9989 / LMG 20990 / NBRC 107835 / XIL07) TaxID=446471 RepID=D1BV22_XYLCX|nr:LysE/ArgO family amino acid transporter [Xylanimonas cellulosilytica]ACZ31261.1 Lysine exporter protein (LYSE/YGGA) [Xylanimonas cellulosilytica DSM 15894]